ncbi:MAG: hypothetical protein FWE95_05615 [Planctomycetaceae bacterium]|nr:hypothetical protein [Planctomycetaceae bacterium]
MQVGEKTKQDNGEQGGAGMRSALFGTRIGHCFEALGKQSERIESGWERRHVNLRVEKEKGWTEYRYYVKKADVLELLSKFPTISPKKLVDGMDGLVTKGGKGLQTEKKYGIIPRVENYSE